MEGLILSSRFLRDPVRRIVVLYVEGVILSSKRHCILLDSENRKKREKEIETHPEIRDKPRHTASENVYLLRVGHLDRGISDILKFLLSVRGRRRDNFVGNLANLVGR